MTEGPIEDVTEREQPTKRHGDALEDLVRTDPDRDTDRE